MACIVDYEYDFQGKYISYVLTKLMSKRSPSGENILRTYLIMKISQIALNCPGSIVRNVFGPIANSKIGGFIDFLILKYSDPNAVPPVGTRPAAYSQVVTKDLKRSEYDQLLLFLKSPTVDLDYIDLITAFTSKDIGDQIKNFLNICYKNKTLVKKILVFLGLINEAGDVIFLTQEKLEGLKLVMDEATEVVCVERALKKKNTALSKTGGRTMKQRNKLKKRKTRRRL
jgi:hypothetical protein